MGDSLSDDVSFDELNINDNILRGVYAYGFEKPSAIQVKAIPKIISGGTQLHKHNPEQVKLGLFQLVF